VGVAAAPVGASRGRLLGGVWAPLVGKNAAAGSALWPRQFGTSATDFPTGVAVDASGVYVTGYTLGILPGQAGDEGFFNAFVRKYDAAGNELWTRQFGASRFDVGQGVAVDASGVYVVGTTDGLPRQA